MKDFVLLRFPAMAALAKEILEDPRVAGHAELQSDISWQHFPDGYPNLFISNARCLAGKRIVILLSFYDMSTLFEQLSGAVSYPPHQSAPAPLTPSQSCSRCRGSQSAL